MKKIIFFISFFCVSTFIYSQNNFNAFLEKFPILQFPIDTSVLLQSNHKQISIKKYNELFANTNDPYFINIYSEKEHIKAFNLNSTDSYFRNEIVEIELELHPIGKYSIENKYWCVIVKYSEKYDVHFYLLIFNKKGNCLSAFDLVKYEKQNFHKKEIGGFFHWGLIENEKNIYFLNKQNYEDNLFHVKKKYIIDSEGIIKFSKDLTTISEI